LPDPKSKRPRRWLRRFFLVAAAIALALGSAVLLALWRLDAIAKWTIHRVFPGVVAEMGSLRLVSSTRLEVRKLVLRSTKTREPLLALENGSAVFSFARVWRAQLEELTLLGPDLAVSPDLGDALGISASRNPAPSGKSGFAWAIARFSVSDGRLRIARFGEQSPTVELHFSADFQNFGVGGEAGDIEHAVRLDHIAAMDKAGRKLLDIADVDLLFTTDELFARDHLRAARIGKGSLTVAQSLLDFLQPNPAPRSTAVVPDAPGWSVGALDLEELRVLVPDAPGVIGKVDFTVTATLHDLGGPGTPQSEAMQRVLVSQLLVATDREPLISLLRATSAEASFTLAGLARMRIEELRLKNPSIDFSPKALAPETSPSPAPKPAAATQAPRPPEWLIAHALCKSGTMRLRGLQGGTLELATRFAFDARNLGTAGDTATAEQELTLWDTQASGGASKAFLTADVARVRFTVADLLERRRVDSVKVDGGRLLVGEALQKLLTPAPAAPQGTAAAPAGPEWSIGALDISGVRTRIEDKRPGVTDLRFTLNTSMRDVSASGVPSQVFDQTQTVELANIDLNSPIHKGAKILTLRSVFVRFTLRELARKHLTEVVIREPIIYLSEDLFIYMERASAPEKPVTNGSPQPPAPAGPGWSVDHLEAKSGKLVIGSGGQKDVGLPIQFETTMDDVALDNLAKLKVQAALRVPRQSYDFPAYQLGVEDVQGDLRFAYPPEKGEKNLVQKLEMKKIRWRQFQSREAWIAVTFDARGINGQFGGQAYRGYVNGGFSFFFRDDAPWEGWVAGTDVDTSAVTDVMAPQNFRLTGPLDFEVQLDAFRKDISRMRGNFRVKQPGRLHIGKLDDLLANIPPEWPAIKQSSTRIALEALRDFDYTHAAGDFWFVESQGILGLRLTGPLGSRNFEVALHDDTETRNQWQKGTLGNR
jgi:hypothetical protein